jgi:hypothetical protein
VTKQTKCGTRAIGNPKRLPNEIEKATRGYYAWLSGEALKEEMLSEKAFGEVCLRVDFDSED